VTTSVQEMQWVLRAQVGVLAHFFMLLIWVTALTLIVVIQITAMTKRILRAVELTSRRT
jgi:hypothetical protein